MDFSENNSITKKSIDDNINIYLLHSWTKFFSCTGLRIGSLLCPSENTYNLIKKNIVPWNCNILALKYLDAAINDDAYINYTWNNTSIIRNQQINILKKNFNNWVFGGAKFIPWIWIKVPSKEVAEKLYNISKKCGMPIRWGKTGYNKNNYIRIAIRNIDKFNLLTNLWKNELNK
jgi:histidinol-phosphate/aromatic aminotransferase/cobyric acid decarboxylase-like protein